MIVHTKRDSTLWSRRRERRESYNSFYTSRLLRSVSSKMEKWKMIPVNKFSFFRRIEPGRT